MKKSLLLFLASSNFAFGIPEFIKEAEYQVDVIDRGKPIWSIETIQSLSHSSNRMHTFYFQPRISFRDDDEIYSGTVGYRYLSCDACWLAGAYGFVDANSEHWHDHAGFGGELMLNQFTFRGNYYHPISKSKVVSETTEPLFPEFPQLGSIVTTVSERPISGWDVSFETPLPYLPWARFIIEKYHWNGDNRGDRHGWAGALQLNVSDHLIMEFGRRADNHHNENFVQLSFNIFGLLGETEYTMVRTPYSCEMFPRRNLCCHTLDKVRRFQNVEPEERTRVVEFATARL